MVQFMSARWPRRCACVLTSLGACLAGSLAKLGSQTTWRSTTTRGKHRWKIRQFDPVCDGLDLSIGLSVFRQTSGVTGSWAAHQGRSLWLNSLEA